MRVSKEQGEKALKHHLKYIKRAIKKKISLYEPLEFEPTYTKFIQWVKIPVDGEVETYLNHLIKNFLIENAYFALEEKYIQRVLMNKLGSSDPNEIRLLEIGDFIREKLEKEGLKRLKGFKERAKFKTFLTTAVIRLLYDFWRQKRSKEEHVTKYEPEFDALFDSPVDDPLSRLIQLEDERFKNKAAAFLPRVLDKLDFKERLAIQLKYENGMNVSAIARTLERTRFKTEQFIIQIEDKVSKEILSRIKRGGNHEAP